MNFSAGIEPISDAAFFISLESFQAPFCYLGTFESEPGTGSRRPSFDRLIIEMMAAAEKRIDIREATGFAW